MKKIVVFDFDGALSASAANYEFWKFARRHSFNDDGVRSDLDWSANRLPPDNDGINPFLWTGRNGSAGTGFFSESLHRPDSFLELRPAPVQTSGTAPDFFEMLYVT